MSMTILEPATAVRAPGSAVFPATAVSRAHPVLRLYPRNSAEAAARIVALALLADGRVDAVESAALDAMLAHEQLGMPRQRWDDVIRELSEDLVQWCRGTDGCRIDGAVLDRLLDDVEDDDLRRIVMRLCLAVAHADQQVDPCEAFVLVAAAQRWGFGGEDHDLMYGRDFQVKPRGSCDFAFELRPS